ncbi:MAG: ABC transporter ATP-binding protein [Chitinophagaceae bacterium]|nr:MAG: ABC transporter ATP-binding protein [Chitinophagaceae bacterium]
MKHLSALNKYFWKYKYRFGFGILFIILSNYFAILAPQITGYIFNMIQDYAGENTTNHRISNYDPLVHLFINELNGHNLSFSQRIGFFGASILVFALLSGFFLFLMRQTIIVMSRYIEFDQKDEVFSHYLTLDANFYKTHSTGDLMSRIAEDVSRVRMYTGPAIMYLVNLVFRISFCLFYMFKKDPVLTLYVLSPLPILAITIYVVNTIINKKSENIQAKLADLTTNAQESYSGIRVIKSFVQENAMYKFFHDNSEDYKRNAISLAKLESIYFPSMTLLIGLSTLLTIMIGGLYAARDPSGEYVSTIVEFVMYINLLTFPVSAIGWTASMIQRGAASQKRLNEFLHTKSMISDPVVPSKVEVEGDVVFGDVNFTYPNTGIHALKNFNLTIRKGQKIAIIGHTGSGKTTIAQLLLRMYDPGTGKVTVNGVSVKDFELTTLRNRISYVPQDVFLFSDSVANNIRFGKPGASMEEVKAAAVNAYVDKEITGFSKQYDTLVGERGVTLSGGQKQRISIARALIGNPEFVLFDDCLSAVDAKTEKEILTNLNRFLQNRTAIIITHRIFTLLDFDKIIVMEDGEIVEQGTHDELLAANGYYTFLYNQQRHEQEDGDAENSDSG